MPNKPDLKTPAAQLSLYRGLGGAIAEISQTVTLERHLSQAEQLTRGVQGICQIAMGWRLDIPPLFADGLRRALALENQERPDPGLWLVWSHYARYVPDPRRGALNQESADEYETGTAAFAMARIYAALTEPAPECVHVKAPDGTTFRYCPGGTVHVDLPEEKPADA